MKKMVSQTGHLLTKQLRYCRQRKLDEENKKESLPSTTIISIKRSYENMQYISGIRHFSTSWIIVSRNPKQFSEYSGMDKPRVRILANFQAVS